MSEDKVESIKTQVILPYYIVDTTMKAFNRDGYAHITIGNCHVSLSNRKKRAHIPQERLLLLHNMEGIFNCEAENVINLIRISRPLPKEFWPDKIVYVRDILQSISGTESVPLSISVFVNTKGVIRIWIDPKSGKIPETVGLDMFTFKYKVASPTDQDVIITDLKLQLQKALATIDKLANDVAILKVEVADLRKEINPGA